MNIQQIYLLHKVLFYRILKFFYLKGQYEMREYISMMTPYESFFTSLTNWPILKENKINFNNIHNTIYFFLRTTNVNGQSKICASNLKLIRKILYEIGINEAIDIITKILIKDKVTNNYITNVNKYYKTQVTDLQSAFNVVFENVEKNNFNIHVLLARAFSWSQTPEGYYFWQNIYQDFFKQTSEISFKKIFKYIENHDNR